MSWNQSGPGGGHNPWGEGAPRGRPRPQWSGPRPPDLDRLIGRLQAWARRLLPAGGGRGPVLLGCAVIALWLLSGFYRVEPDEQGVVLRFGAFVRSTPPGLNYHLPWPIETVLLPAVTRINRTEIGYRGGAPDRGPDSGGLRDVAQESLMLTGDENIVDINCTVFWRISDARAFLFNTRHPVA